MNTVTLWFQVEYAGFLVVCLSIVVALVRERWTERRAQWAAYALCAIALLVGAPFSVAATPDWNPFTMFALYAPCVAIAIWGIAFVRFVGRGLPQAAAIRRAAPYAALTIVATPLVFVLVSLAWVPAMVVSAVLLTRMRRTIAPSDSCSGSGIDDCSVG